MPSSEKNHLVSLQDVKDYILSDKSNILSEYGKKRVKIIIDNVTLLRHNRFNNQIPKGKCLSFVFNNQYTYSDVVYRNKLIEMISSFTRKRKEVFQMLEKHTEDKYIIDFIANHHMFIKKLTNPRLYKLAKVSDKIDKYIKKTSSKAIKIPKILDVGCGDGRKIKTISTLMNCSIYGADIKEWGPYSSTKKFDFPFKTIQLSPYKIPYRKSTFDCILLSLVLHHADNIYDVLNECSRLLKKEGIILLVEHDVWTYQEDIIVEAQHKLYETINNEKKDSYKGSYYNFFEWDIIFDRCDFEPVFSDRLYEGINSIGRYDNQFYGVYKKK